MRAGQTERGAGLEPLASAAEGGGWGGWIPWEDGSAVPAESGFCERGRAGQGLGARTARRGWASPADGR